MAKPVWAQAAARSTILGVVTDKSGAPIPGVTVTLAFRIPFDATGKKWVRFAAWDVAGNGALVQPIKLTSTTTGTEGP